MYSFRKGFKKKFIKKKKKKKLLYLHYKSCWDCQLKKQKKSKMKGKNRINVIRP